MRRCLSLCLAVLLTPLASSNAQSDSASVVAVIDQFHYALAAGDSAGAMALLAPDAVVLEGGSVENREDYAAGHLMADMAFVEGMTRVVVDRNVTMVDGVAWVSSLTDTDGNYDGREIKNSGAELMILAQVDGEWRIRAIHWSSGRR